MKATGITAIVILAATIVAACQTGPTRPLMSPFDEGDGYGYGEHRVHASRYEVSYQGPRSRTWLSRERRAEDVEKARKFSYDLALWRAAELASQQGFAAFAVEDSQTEVEVEIIDEAPFYGYSDYFYHDHQFAGYHPYGYDDPIYRSAWMQVSVTLTVGMKDAADDGAFDTDATAKRLEETYPEALTVPDY